MSFWRSFTQNHKLPKFMKISKQIQSVLIVLLLISSGCGLIKPSHHDTEEYTPVFAAAAAGDLKTVKEALTQDSTLIKKREWDKATLLHGATEHDQIEIVKFLLDNGADVNSFEMNNITPLHISAQNGNIELMELLINKGAKINAIDKKGWTPLDRAIRWENPDAADFLKKKGGIEKSKKK